MLLSFHEVNEYLESRRTLGIKPGLERLDYLLAKTDHPERKIKTIHLAGTNGKGSTLTFIQEVLIANGYRVGSFVSPGFPTVRDHILWNHKPISEKVFLELLNQLVPTIEEMDQKDMAPTEYEILMVICLLFFINRVDIALIETGMGGKEDITNRVIPILTIITSISFDHTAFLGDTLASIASHKAGIIKKNTPVILGRLPEEAHQVVIDKAKQERAPMYILGADFNIHDSHSDWEHQSFLFQYKQIKWLIEITMQGIHQMENAANAMMAIECLKEQGWTINEESVRNGMKHARISNRMEVVAKNPITIVDGAHNMASIKALRRTIEVLYPNKKVYLLFSAFRDKEVNEMLKYLDEMATRLVVTSFEHSRALKSKDLYAEWDYIPNAKKAYEVVKNTIQKGDLLLITGSLHFVEQMKRIIK